MTSVRIPGKRLGGPGSATILDVLVAKGLTYILVTPELGSDLAPVDNGFADGPGPQMPAES